MALPTLRREEVAAIETETMTQCEGCWFCDDDDKSLMEDKNVYRTEAARLKALFENPKGFLTYKELAEILGLSVRTLRRYVNLEQIPHKYIGRNVRFIPSELARHFANQGEAS